MNSNKNICHYKLCLMNNLILVPLKSTHEERNNINEANVLVKTALASKKIFLKILKKIKAFVFLFYDISYKISSYYRYFNFTCLSFIL